MEGSHGQSEQQDSPLPPVLPLLPPCRICGDKSTGVHYGAVTCESCKAFFLRCQRTKRKIKCSNSKSCQVLQRRAKEAKCTKCRYERCLAAGMSKHASRNGRHTHKEKTKFILEAKAYGSATDHDPLESDRHSPDFKVENERTKNINVDVSVAPRSKVHSEIVEEVNEDLESMIDHLIEVYYQNTDCTPEFLAGMEQREQQFLEQKQLEKELFGERKSLSKDEYVAAQKTTGLDVDGRRELVDKFNQTADALANQLINFAKAIPGFSEVGVEDQASVVKNAARNGAYIIMQYKMFNTEQQLFHCLTGTLFDRDNLVKLYSEDMIDSMLVALKRIHGLKLTDGEMVMSAAVCMLLVDQYHINQPDRVNRCLEKCLDCLMYLFRRNHPGDRLMFPKMVGIITSFRTAEHQMITAKEYQETFNLQFNQLWHELWNT